MGVKDLCGFLLGYEIFATVFADIDIITAFNGRAHPSGHIDETTLTGPILELGYSKSITLHELVEPVQQGIIQLVSNQLGLFLQSFFLCLVRFFYLHFDLLELPEKSGPAYDLILRGEESEFDFTENFVQFFFASRIKNPISEPWFD